jgi:hypothetical protein
MTKAADRESLLQAFEPNCYGDGNVYRGVRNKDSERKIIYVESQKKEWVGLTQEEIKLIWKESPHVVGLYTYTDIAEQVEAKLKEKNT